VDPVIDINGNDELNASTSIGNGTVINPYLIEDQVIDGTTFCIRIRNTDAHFKIQNCTLYSVLTPGNGLILENVTNAQVIESNLTESIYLNNSHFNLFNNNTCEKIIYFNYSHNNTYSNLIFDSATIEVNNSMNASIMHNQFIDSYCPIRVKYSNFTAIYNNSILDFTGDAIKLMYCHNGSIRNNTIEYEGFSAKGLYAVQCTGLYIYRNYMDTCGIQLDATNHSSITYNNVKYIGESQDCSDNDISNNDIQDGEIFNPGPRQPTFLEQVLIISAIVGAIVAGVVIAVVVIRRRRNRK